MLANYVDVSYNKPVVQSIATESKSTVKQSVVIDKSVSYSKQKRKGKICVHVCHFCGVKVHIRPRCFTLMTFLENNYEKTNFSRYFQKPTPRPKIDLDNEPRKMSVKKSSFTCLRISATNSWYLIVDVLGI